MKNNYFKIAVFVIVFIFTFIIRAHNYERVPTANHLDEMLYAWSGLYLVETGTPVSWSTLSYPESAKVYEGEINYKGGLPKSSVKLYSPWLDEPPLFSVIVGWFAHIFGADRSQFIPSSFIRFPMIFISTLTSLFIFLIARKISGFWTGLLSMFLYGTIPIFVFASRTALPETLIALIFTVIIYLMLFFREHFKFRYILAVPLLVGIAGLSKPTGFFLIFYAIFLSFMWLYKANKIKIALRYCSYLFLATIPFVFFYIAYGTGYDKEIFWRIFTEQANRPVGFAGLTWFLISPSFGTAILKDSWYVFALVVVIHLIFTVKDELKKLIVFSFIFWVLVVMFSGGEGDLLAWYRFPSFPMLSIAAAWGLIRIVKKADFFSSFLGIGLLLGNRSLLVNAFRPNIMPLPFKVIFAGLLTPSLLNMIYDRKVLLRISRILLIIVAAAGIYMNILYIYNAFELECQSKSCAIVPGTWLSEIHFPVIWRLFVLK